MTWRIERVRTGSCTRDGDDGVVSDRIVIHLERYFPDGTVRCIDCLGCHVEPCAGSDSCGQTGVHEIGILAILGIETRRNDGKYL